jgi:hypothetical protein
MDVIVHGNLELAPPRSKLLSNYGNFFHNILAKFGYAEFPPVADLLRQAQKLEGQWLVATPVHWRASHNDAVIVECGQQLALPEKESQRCFQIWSKFVAGEGMETHFYDEGTWLLKPGDKPLLQAKPAHQMLQCSMLPELEKLDKTLYWQKLITECQMLFASQALNTSSAHTGQTINGVWFWGQGNLSAKGSIPIVVNHNNLLTLSRVLSTQISNYSSRASIQKDALILWEPTSPEGWLDLQGNLKTKSVCWYGNDRAYQTRPKNWLARLWRF